MDLAARLDSIEINSNGVELELAEVREHSGELSKANYFPIDHHRTARAVPLTQRHSSKQGWWRWPRCVVISALRIYWIWICKSSLNNNSVS